jgi:multiple antibiotic resistance protein
MALDFLKTALVTLLVTLDPPGLAPLFIGLTLGMTRAAKHEVALRASVIAFVILAAFALGGRFVLGALGVTIPAFRIAGGLLLFYIAFAARSSPTRWRSTTSATSPPFRWRSR